MEFEWDIDKNKANQKKHKISFEEAAEIFRYPTNEINDTRFNYGETRYRANKQEKRMYYDYCT